MRFSQSEDVLHSYLQIFEKKTNSVLENTDQAFHLTLPPTANFRLFQTERDCRR